MSHFLDAVARHYDHSIIDAGKQPQFFIFIAFLVTFLTVRAITHAIRRGAARRIFRNVSAGGTHLHHLVWGILLLLITGYLAIAFDLPTSREPLAILFGAGAALTLDEFALWLDLEDDYWTERGRRSIDAVLITLALLGLVLAGLRFWINLGREIGRLLNLT